MQLVAKGRTEISYIQSQSVHIQWNQIRLESNVV